MGGGQTGPADATAIVGAVVDDLRAIPDEHRSFTVTRGRAGEQYRIPAGVIDAAVARGLPHATGREQRFDHYDLVNLSLDLGIKSVWTYTTSTWHRPLSGAAKVDRMRYAIGYTPTCPTPGHAGTCEFSVFLPDVGWTDRPRRPGSRAPVATATVQLRSAWPALPAPALELIDEFSTLRFRRLPPSIQLDVDFVRRSGMSDCAAAATLLEREGQARGVPIRFAFGLIVAPPFSSVHCWNEIRVDDSWVPIDPLILGAMLKWKYLDPAEWSPYRSPGAILARLSDEIVPTGLHAGELTEVTFPTRVLTS